MVVMVITDLKISQMVRELIYKAKMTVQSNRLIAIVTVIIAQAYQLEKLIHITIMASNLIAKKKMWRLEFLLKICITTIIRLIAAKCNLNTWRDKVWEFQMLQSMRVLRWRVIIWTMMRLWRMISWMMMKTNKTNLLLHLLKTKEPPQMITTLKYELYTIDN